MVAGLAALGYVGSWLCVRASDVGAPHRRERLFILAHPADPDREPVRPAALGLAGRCGPAVAGDAGPRAVSLLPTPAARLGDRWGQPNADTATRRMVDEGRRNLEDAVALLPTPRARDGKGRDPNPRGVDLNEAVALLPTPRATDGTKGGPNQCHSDGSLALSAVVQPGRWGSYNAAIDRWAAILGRPAPDPTEPGTRGQPRLSPRFVEWLMGLPAGWVTDHVGRNAALRILGNGVVPQQGAHALAHLTDSRPGLTRVSPHTHPRPAGTPSTRQETP